MSDYTPTDGEILTAVVLYRTISGADAPPPSIETIATPEVTKRYLGEYQRWLAEHDAALIEKLADKIRHRQHAESIRQMLRDQARQRREEQDR